MILIRNGFLQYPLKSSLQKENLYYFIRNLDNSGEISQFFIFSTFFLPPPVIFPKILDGSPHDLFWAPLVRP